MIKVGMELIPLFKLFSYRQIHLTLKNRIKTKKPQTLKPAANKYSIFSYVGIIRIRLWVETHLFPLSHSAPRFYIQFYYINNSISHFPQKVNNYPHFFIFLHRQYKKLIFVQEYDRHAQFNITADTYSHVDNSGKLEETAKITEVLNIKDYTNFEGKNDLLQPKVSGM